MAHPLDGVHEKVGRAYEQFNALYRSIETFIKGQDQRLWAEHDGNTNEYVVKLAFSEDRWLAWGVICGEIVHDLRSALDHLVYALTVHDRGRSYAQTAFPIFVDKGKCSRRKANGDPAWGSGLYRIRGLDTPGRRLVKGLQPYTAIERGEDPESDSLWLLDSLWNTDKHRTINVTAAALAVRNLRVVLPGGFIPQLRDQFSVGLVEGDTVLARFTAPLLDPRQVHVQAEIAKQVAFGDLIPPEAGVIPAVDVTLHILAKHVGDIVLMFEPLFD